MRNPRSSADQPTSSSSATFRDLTTLRVGGNVGELVETHSTEDFAEAVIRAWGDEMGWFVLGGGSNLVVSSDGFPGVVVFDRTAEVVTEDVDSGVLVTVSAGYNWDDFVAFTIAEGLSGVEALSGIPGNVGAAPVQNIGAYGIELAQVLHSIDFLDEEFGLREWVPARELGLGYRTSTLKRGRRGAVLRVRFLLERSHLSQPIGYSQLAERLGVSIGDRLPLDRVRETVLALRSSKGMVLDGADPDSVSAGSFFTNPIVPASVAAALPSGVPRWPVESTVSKPNIFPLGLDGEPADQDGFVNEVTKRSAQWQRAEKQVKLSAAWLIEQSGVPRGFRLPGSGAAISSKHTLAIVNTGGASGEQVAELARFIQSRVASEFGVVIVPEPLLLGLSL